MAKILRFEEFAFEGKKETKTDKKVENDKDIYIEFKVKNKGSLYKQTDAVINGKAGIERAIKHGYVSCGDGCDYKLDAEEIQQLKDGKYDTFKPTHAFASKKNNQD